MLVWNNDVRTVMGFSMLGLRTTQDELFKVFVVGRQTLRHRYLLNDPVLLGPQIIDIFFKVF